MSENIRTKAFREDMGAYLDDDLRKVWEEMDILPSLVILAQILREIKKGN